MLKPKAPDQLHHINGSLNADDHRTEIIQTLRAWSMAHGTFRFSYLYCAGSFIAAAPKLCMSCAVIKPSCLRYGLDTAWRQPHAHMGA
jgi:hypothetical protein